LLIILPIKIVNTIKVVETAQGKKMVIATLEDYRRYIAG
jgi:hypothetical protein